MRLLAESSALPLCVLCSGLFRTVGCSAFSGLGVFLGFLGLWMLTLCFLMCCCASVMGGPSCGPLLWLLASGAHLLLRLGIPAGVPGLATGVFAGLLLHGLVRLWSLAVASLGGCLALAPVQMAVLNLALSLARSPLSVAFLGWPGLFFWFQCIPSLWVLVSWPCQRRLPYVLVVLSVSVGQCSV